MSKRAGGRSPFGGNALITRCRSTTVAPRQYDAVCAHRAAALVDMVEQGWNVVVTHGNGPQVGFILRRSEIADGQVPTVPVRLRGRRYAGRDRLHVPERARQRARRRGIDTRRRRAGHADGRRPRRSGVRAPDKPVGSFLTEDVARGLARRARLDDHAGCRPRLAAHDRLAAAACAIVEAPIIASACARRRAGRRVRRRRHRGRGQTPTAARRGGGRRRQGPRLGAAGHRNGRRPADDSDRRPARRDPLRQARAAMARPDHRRARPSATPPKGSSAKAAWARRSRRSLTS